MGMAYPTQRWTAEMVRTLPDDGQRYEVVDGELLVTPAPVRRHQRMVGQLFRLVADYVEQHGLGEALCSPAGIAQANISSTARRKLGGSIAGKR